jgi:hypothetical protein
MSERVSVDRTALDALIEYADSARTMRDGEFCCSHAERDESDREYGGLVAALDVRDTDD